jgi:predicted TIM-barrel fold metal-dependent hydrolase
MLGANGLGKPFGHPLYHPIYAAAAEMGLPVIIVSGGDLSSTVPSHPTAGGAASYYSDYHTLTSQALMTHASTLVGQGVFDHFPDLKVILVGGGIAWVVPFLAEFDTNYKEFRRDTPWLRHAPTEYFHRNIRVGTYPLDRPHSPAQFAKYLGTHPGLEDVVCYASGYPNWDTDTVADIEEWLPEAWIPKVLHENSDKAFRWA